jgi:dTDP-4-dehydrorhamnose reductase
MASERILVTGATGQLGGYLLRRLQQEDCRALAWTGSRTGQLFGAALQPVDLADPAALAAAFRQGRPTHVIHCGAISSVAECFRQPALAQQVNTRGTAVLAELAAQAGARFVFVSTDLVFDGEKGSYAEDDATAPLSHYGRTKAEAEKAVLSFPGTVVVRSSLLFGPSLTGRPGFFDHQLAALREGRPVTLFEDEWRTPLGLNVAAQALLAIARADFGGLLHLGGPERMSRLEMGRRIAAALGLDASSIVPGRRDLPPPSEPRPRDVSLDSRRWRALFPDQAWPTLEEALRP